MKRKNSKFIISSLFVGVFASSALLGVLKGVDFSNEANIYIHGQKNKIEDVYKLNFDSLIPHDISLYEESTDGSETGEGGDGSEGGETTTPPTTSSKKESQAEWAQIAFMTAALSGTYGFEGDKYEGNTDIIYDDTILFSENQDWNQTDIVKFISYPNGTEATTEQQKFAKLYNYSSGIKFYTETTGNTIEKKSIDRYIKDLADPDINPSSEMLEVQRHMETYSRNNNVMEFGWDDLIDIAISKNDFTINGEELSGKKILKKDFGIIINTKDYRMEVTSFLYTYAYLWQDSNSTVYDYKLTEELVALRPSFIWQQDVVSSSTTTAIDPNAFDTAVEGQITEDEIGTTANSNWNTWGDYEDKKGEEQEGKLVGEWDITYDDYTQLPNGLVGYRGIQTQNNSALGSVDSQFWNYKNEFNYEGDTTTIKDDSQLAVAKTGDAMLYNQFDEVEGTGSYLITGTADEEGNSSSYTLAHSIITPYVFANGYNEETGLANKWEYSLYGIVDDDGIVTNINDDTNESIDNSIFNNYTPLIVGDNNESALAKDKDYLSNDQKYAITALYIIYSIYNAESSGEETTSNPLLNNAYKYWNDQGFYIELTGSYYDDYSELLPKLIQKDYGKK